MQTYQIFIIFLKCRLCSGRPTRLNSSPLVIFLFVPRFGFFSRPLDNQPAVCGWIERVGHQVGCIVLRIWGANSTEQTSKRKRLCRSNVSLWTLFMCVDLQLLLFPALHPACGLQ